MQKLLSRFFSSGETPEPISPGIYQRMIPEDVETPNRLHLRIEPNGHGLLLVNAAIVLHLNPTAAEHVYFWLKGNSEGQAAQEIAKRYRVSQSKAFENQREIREKILRLAETPDLDPVLFLGLDRTEPYSEVPPAPYRIDCALTYKTDVSGTYDPLARARVEVELSTEEWKGILKKAWEAGIPHATFTGGEPCLREDLPALISYCEELGQVSGLLTDGLRLSDKKYLQALDQAGLDHILITFDPSDSKSVKGLKAALATDIFTAVHLLVEDATVMEILDDLAEQGVPAVSLSASDLDNQEMLQEARDHAAYLGLDLIWDLPVPYTTRNPISLELENRFPGDGRAWLYVEPDADVLPAQGIDFILGNMLRDPWDQIWTQAKAWYAEQFTPE
jgi:MoaA/NifB/PqqE/SkfB family radical SAM enzyme